MIAPLPPPLELDRHELLWVFEQCEVTDWPFPLRPVHWAAETAEETTIHRGRTEQRMRARGLLEPGAARLLLAAGELFASWTLATDLVHRSSHAPCAAVAATDGARAWVLASAEHAAAPVRLVTCDPAGLPEALLGLLGPGMPGSGGPWPVSARPGTDVPSTRRAETAREATEELVATATGFGQVGATARPSAPPPPPPPSGPRSVVRVRRLVGWLDGPRGRYRLDGAVPGTGRPALLVPVNDAHLCADIRTLLTEARSGVPATGFPAPAPSERAGGRRPQHGSSGRSSA